MEQLDKILVRCKGMGLITPDYISEEEKISFTFHSTAIEGSSLTYDEVYHLLKDNIAAKRTLKQNQMNLDHAEAYEYALKKFKEMPEMSVEYIQSVCERVMKNTGKVINSALGAHDESKGDFRLVAVHVKERYFPGHDKVKGLTKAMCEKFNERFKKLKTNKDALDISAAVHYNLVSIHPFSDGNGRTARIIMNGVLYANNMPRVILKVENKDLYYKALEQTREKKDTEIFTKYIYKNYINQLKESMKNQKQSDKGKEKGMYMSF